MDSNRIPWSAVELKYFDVMEAIDRIGDRRPAMTVNSITICIGWWGSIVCDEECESWANRAVSFFSIVVDEQSTLNYVNTRVWVPSTVNNGPRFLLVVQFCWRCPKFFSTACQFCNYNELYMHWRSPWVSSTVFRRLRINEEVILRSPKHSLLIGPHCKTQEIELCQLLYYSCTLSEDLQN